MITSKENPKYKKWLKLSQKKYRQKDQLFLIEGEHLVTEAKKAGMLVEVLICEGVVFDIDATKTYLTKPLFEKLTQTITSSGIMAVCAIREKEIAKNNRLLLIDGVRDPGNLGTLIRSALAFGFDGIILSEDTVDIYNEKVIRATQGALFNLPIKRSNLTDDVIELQKSGTMVYATSLNQASKEMTEILPADRMAFIVGNEGAGVCAALVEACCGSIIIKMASVVESLNVGVAGSILMQHFNGLTK